MVGVLSFNTRTGAVVAADGDYDSNQITVAAARLVGNSTNVPGLAEDITVGSGLLLDTGSLSAGGVPRSEADGTASATGAAAASKVTFTNMTGSNGMTVATNNKVTVPTKGLYRGAVSLKFPGGADGLRGVILYKDGVVTKWTTLVYQTGAAVCWLNLAYEIMMNAGTYVEVYAYATTNLTLDDAVWGHSLASREL